MTARLALVRPSLLLIGLCATIPASAQYYYGPPGYGPQPGPYSYNAPPPVGREYGRRYEDDEYPPPRAPRPISGRNVVDRLEDMGYEDVGRPRFTGTLYIVQATGPGGVRQEIVVDAIRGIILNRTAVAPSPSYRDDVEPPQRRYGSRPLDTDDLYRRPEEVQPRRAPQRREAARPLESTPIAPPDDTPDTTALPPPADPRLDPSAQAPAKPAPRPFEGRSGNREARSEPRRDVEPKESGTRPFGLNPKPPVVSTPKTGEDGKAAQPATPPKKPVAEARPKPDKPVRVIQGVTPLATGESRSQLDSLPKPPDAPAPTGE